MVGYGMARVFARFFLVVVCVGVAACVAPERRQAEAIPWFPALNGAGGLEAVPDVDVLELSEPMRRLLDQQVAIYPEMELRRQALRRLFSDPSLLRLKYDRSQSRTAAETFSVGAADCVSFSNMAVAMARYVGLEAYYQDVAVRSNWERSGDLVVFRRHMNVIAGKGRQFEVYDFFAGPGRGGVVISDERARAQYFNNRGMVYFRAGQSELALRYLKRALLIDPGLSYVWSNIGAVYSGNRQYAAAEVFLRRALAVDRDNGSALVNLSELYRKQGREEEAGAFARMAEPYRRKNPYYLYELAQAAYAGGRYWVALDELQGALALKSDVEFYEMRARIYLRLGEVDAARKSCQDAAGLNTRPRGVCTGLELSTRR